MANQNVSLAVTQTDKLALKAFDVNGNDITSLVAFAVVSSAPSIVSVGGSQNLGWVVKGLAAGAATITRTGSNASGSLTETDTISVTVAAPISMQATYSVGP